MKRLSIKEVYRHIIEARFPWEDFDDVPGAGPSRLKEPPPSDGITSKDLGVKDNEPESSEIVKIDLNIRELNVMYRMMTAVSSRHPTNLSQEAIDKLNEFKKVFHDSKTGGVELDAKSWEIIYEIIDVFLKDQSFNSNKDLQTIASLNGITNKILGELHL